MTADREKEWFESWFDETYLQLYHYRDPREARRIVTWLASVLEPCSDRKVVDLACGAGRHAWIMALEHGWKVTGLDLSTALLQKAEEDMGRQVRSLLEMQQDEGEGPEFVRGDLRNLPLPSNTYDFVANFFTSFGYFETDEEHQRALTEFQRVMKPGGALMMDLFNPTVILPTMEPSSVGRTSKFKVREERVHEPDKRRVVKTMTMTFPNGESRQVIERVRYFDRDELTEFLKAAGLEPKSWHGDYNGNSFNPLKSRRMVVLARKEA